MELLNNTPVTALIMLFTVITSIYAFNDNSLYGKFMLHPFSISRGQKVYTLITSGLIHADWMHLIFNMITLFSFGRNLEASIGSGSFAAIYIIGLILSDIPTVFKHKNDFWYNSLGASGAVSAVLFASILVFPFQKIYLMFIPFGVWAVIFGPLYLIYCVYAAKQARDNINHDAHFYGALTGMIVMVIIFPGIIPHFLEQVQAKIG